MLRSKVQMKNESGFTLERSDLHPSLFEFQKDMVLWAAQRGRALIAASFGLGKTRLQVELLRQAHLRTGQSVLVICPLGVRHQFIHEDGPAMDVRFVYVRNDEEALAANTPYLITNYERVRDGNLTTEFLSTIGAVSLDEGAILGNLGTKTQYQFNILLADIPYRWVATATPAPYDYHQHIQFNEAMGDRLPAKFMLMPPQAPEEYDDMVWTDVLFMRTLNMSQARRRQEKHLCPLPIDVVERLIVRYSNADEMIFDPFAGIGTTPYMAIKLGRRSIGTELNPVYFNAFAKYCHEAETERKTPALFDLESLAQPERV